MEFHFRFVTALQDMQIFMLPIIIILQCILGNRSHVLCVIHQEASSKLYPWESVDLFKKSNLTCLGFEPGFPG